MNYNQTNKISRTEEHLEIALELLVELQLIVDENHKKRIEALFQSVKYSDYLDQELLNELFPSELEDGRVMKTREQAEARALELYPIHPEFDVDRLKPLREAFLAGVEWEKERTELTNGKSYENLDAKGIEHSELPSEKQEEVKPQPQEKVDVEYELYHGINTSIAEINAVSGDGSLGWKGQDDLRDIRLKVDSHNTITIHPIKEMKTREQAEARARELYPDIHIATVNQLHEVSRQAYLKGWGEAQDTKLREAAEEWNKYKSFLQEKYPVEEGEEWQFTCEHHQKIDEILNSKKH